MPLEKPRSLEVPATAGICATPPKVGPVCSAKFDVKDGFHRVFLNSLQCLWLAVLMPKCKDKERLVAIHLALTMGWVQSPPMFCAMSETVCNVTNTAFPKDLHFNKPR